LIVAAHQQITKDWWETRRHAFDLYISQLVVDEAGAGDPAAARERLKVIEGLPLLDIVPGVTGMVVSRYRRGFMLHFNLKRGVSAHRSHKLAGKGLR
jgi:hypothetical protein